MAQEADWHNNLAGVACPRCRGFVMRDNEYPDDSVCLRCGWRTGPLANEATEEELRSRLEALRALDN